MTISFRNNFRDRLAFAAYHFPRNPLMIIIVLGSYLLITFTSALPAVREANAKKGVFVEIFSFIFVEVFLACIFLAFMALLIVLTMLSRKNKPFYTQKMLTLREECFVSESEYGKSETRWKVVQKLARTRKYIFIYLSAESALVIPRRAFESVSDWQAFYELSKRNVNLAKTNQQPSITV